MRLHLFEFEDLPWFPDVIRIGGTDYLRYLLPAIELYKPLIPLINETLSETGENRIIDLCSGGGGYIEQVYKGLSENSNKKITITLTDKFPNYQAYNYIKNKTHGAIDFEKFPVDAAAVPKELKGFRVMFSAIHHFQPQQVKAVFQNAVDSNAPIGLFDGGDKNILVILGMILVHPIAFFLFTPFFKPFKISRLFFTYIIPLIPLYTMWDGFVSVLRLYDPKELLQIAKETNADNYVWKEGKVKNKWGIHASYIIGYPAKQ
ncbi:MAG: class I SAM-dependent methyltransferase [Bacteroidia bacterium]